jgi:hypothetical protein
LQIEQSRTEIVSYQTTDKNMCHMFDRFLPQYPARIMRIRHISRQLNQDFIRLCQLSDQLDRAAYVDMTMIYEKFLVFTDQIEKRIYQQWWTRAVELQPRKLLEKPFLQYNQDRQDLIDVYFEPKILVTLNECLWWIRMTFDIPYSLSDVYQTRKSFRQMREEANGFIRKFNK